MQKTANYAGTDMNAVLMQAQMNALDENGQLASSVSVLFFIKMFLMFL